MGKVQFAVHLDPISATGSETGGRPFPYSIHGQKRRFGIWRRKKRRSSVRFMVLGENNLAVVTELFLEKIFHPNPLPDPKRHGHQKRAQSRRHVCEITVQNAVELQKRLLVKSDQREVGNFNAPFAQAIFDSVLRKGSVVLFASKL